MLKTISFCRSILQNLAAAWKHDLNFGKNEDQPCPGKSSPTKERWSVLSGEFKKLVLRTRVGSWEDTQQHSKRKRQATNESDQQAPVVFTKLILML